MATTIPLTKLAHVRAEMAKVYRDTRGDKIKIADGSKLIYMLKELSCVIEKELTLEKGNEGNWTKTVTIYKLNEDAI